MSRGKVLPRYPVYIPSKGRHQKNRALTARFLMRDGCPFNVVVEPQEAEQYAELVGVGRVLELPFSNLGQGSIPARNWIRAHAEAAGAARHWQLDDNIQDIRRLYRGARIPADAGLGLRACEDLTDRYENVGVSGLNYQMFVTDETPVPFFLNVHVYSCVTPETPILCADLTWRPAGELEPGQRVVSFDEEPPLGASRGAREYRTAMIERNQPAVKPSYRVVTDAGIPVTASEEHPWMVWRRPLRERRWRDRPAGEEGARAAQLCWVRTADLRVGDQIAHLSKPWEQDRTHDGGWISGMFDGEGSLVSRATEEGRIRTASVGIAQKEGAVLERLRTVLVERGYDAWMGNGNGARSDGTYLRGGFPEMLRFAGEFRPTRMLNRLPELWEGRKVWRGSTYKLAEVTAVEPVGEQPVASITTSTGTFITGGYLTHNCTLVNHAMPCRWRGRYNEDADLCLQALAGGWCTLLLNAFMADKITTMVIGGGNTDELYAGDGRLEMARSLERAWPGVVKVDRRFGRPQHVIDWKRFRAVQLRKREGWEPPARRVDEYGMRLRQIGELGARMQALLDAYPGRKRRMESA